MIETKTIICVPLKFNINMNLISGNYIFLNKIAFIYQKKNMTNLLQIYIYIYYEFKDLQ